MPTDHTLWERLLDSDAPPARRDPESVGGEGSSRETPHG